MSNRFEGNVFSRQQDEAPNRAFGRYSSSTADMVQIRGMPRSQSSSHLLQPSNQIIQNIQANQQSSGNSNGYQNRSYTSPYQSENGVTRITISSHAPIRQFSTQQLEPQTISTTPAKVVLDSKPYLQIDGGRHTADPSIQPSSIQVSPQPTPQAGTLRLNGMHHSQSMNAIPFNSGEPVNQPNHFQESVTFRAQNVENQYPLSSQPQEVHSSSNGASMGPSIEHLLNNPLQRHYTHTQANQSPISSTIITNLPKPGQDHPTHSIQTIPSSSSQPPLSPRQPSNNPLISTITPPQTPSFSQPPTQPTQPTSFSNQPPLEYRLSSLETSLLTLTEDNSLLEKIMEECRIKVEHNKEDVKKIRQEIEAIKKDLKEVRNEGRDERKGNSGSFGKGPGKSDKDELLDIIEKQRAIIEELMNRSKKEGKADKEGKDGKEKKKKNKASKEATPEESAIGRGSVDSQVKDASQGEKKKKIPKLNKKNSQL